MVLVAGLVELGEHVKLVVDVLRGVPLLVHEQGILIHHFVIILLLSNLHLDISGYEIGSVLLSTVTLRRRRVRVKGLLSILIVRRTGSFALVIIVILLLLEALFHERILTLDARYLLLL